MRDHADLFQFFLPVIIVGILYCSIYLRLKNRPQVWCNNK